MEAISRIKQLSPSPFVYLRDVTENSATAAVSRPEQAVPHHLQEAQVLGLLALSLALVNPVGPRRRFHRGQGVRGKDLRLLAWFAVLSGQALQSGLDQGIL